MRRIVMSPFQGSATPEERKIGWKKHLMSRRVDQDVIDDGCSPSLLWEAYALRKPDAPFFDDIAFTKSKDESKQVAFMAKELLKCKGDPPATANVLLKCEGERVGLIEFETEIGSLERVIRRRQALESTVQFSPVRSYLV
eukprot:scaffold63615_cov26-Cyclotella_meneghiniana.AAC.1